MATFKIQFQKSVDFDEKTSGDYTQQIRNSIMFVVSSGGFNFRNNDNVKFDRESVQWVQSNIKAFSMNNINWASIEISHIESSQKELNDVKSWKMKALLTSDIYECISITDNNFICLSKTKEILFIPRLDVKAHKVS